MSWNPRFPNQSSDSQEPEPSDRSSDDGRPVRVIDEVSVLRWAPPWRMIHRALHGQKKGSRL